MNRKMVAALAAASICGMGNATAQDDEALYVYGTYFKCNASTEGIADALVANSLAPAYDEAVSDGTLNSWGWMAHQTGGKWRRLLYWSVSSQDALFDAPGAIDAKMEELGGPGGGNLNALCPGHEDYVWRSVTGSTSAGETQERGKVGFSAYFICDSDRESRADEIVEQVFAPLYNEQVEAGTLASWGWMEHFIGGEYRRISTTTADDYKSLLKARTAIIEELDSEQQDAFNEFSSICGSHSDYIWDVQHERP